MSRFAQLQDLFQRAVLTGDDRVVETLSQGGREDKKVLMDVYRTAYTARLRDILGHDHNLFATYVGDDKFTEIANAYIAAHPSDQPNARWFSQHFPDFVSRHAEFGKRPDIVELARLEKALNDVFDCVEAPVLQIEDLATIDPEHWERLCFTPHPAAQRLNFKSNAADIWRALKDERDPPSPLQNPVTTKILVWRDGTTPMMRILSHEEAMMWDEAVTGVRFGILCEMAATYDEPESAAVRVANYLQGWIATGLVSTYALQEATRNRIPDNAL